MKQLAAALAIILCLVPLPAHARSRCKKQKIEDLVTEFSNAYMEKAMGRLQPEHPFLLKLKFVIEHSLGEGEYDIKVSGYLEDVDEWLKNREREDGTPFRELRPLIACRKGICTFDFDGGILHNHLYLKKITYGYRNGCPYLKTIYLLDGD
jgi:hypothetical protein